MPPNIVEDYKAGDLICGDCGLVFPMRIIDMRSEWRNFAQADTGAMGEDSSRVGHAENPLMDGVIDQLSTSIARNRGAGLLMKVCCKMRR
jgi:transcription initiation factor TFIIB